jgi:hypothetical protein
MMPEYTVTIQYTGEVDAQNKQEVEDALYVACRVLGNDFKIVFEHDFYTIERTDGEEEE